ncbi:switch-associated protein 70-like [Lytechinus variegatus]|uniref:switch-associated protein 70-like n=1 Tax=Lytechinus variegatus TaxID=7654 RepID=UPI001BB22E5B|nr:switch-associated protein 70-like [Lytechinus variegatus]
MARREECIPRWLWHAFDALDSDKNGSAPKTELKVLTAHIGNSLGAENSNAIAKRLMELFEDHQSIGFNDYREFLRKEKFLVLENMDLVKLEEVSWMICGRCYGQRDKNVLDNRDVYKLWRIFNFFAEPVFPVVLDPQEAAIMFEKLVVAMGMKWSLTEFHSHIAMLQTLTFTNCLKFFEQQYTGKVDKMCVQVGISEVYNNMIEEVEKMGTLRKKGHKVASWKERWFILKPGCIAYYVDKTLKDQKGEIPITKNWKVEVLPEQKGNKNLFTVYSADTTQINSKRRYELNASDPRNRQEWVTAIENVLKRMECGQSPHVQDLESRRDERRKRQEEAEEIDRLRKLQIEENEKQRQRLAEMERLRDEAAQKAEDELALRMAKEREEEENRRRELEERAKTQAEIDALKAARDEAARKAEEELAMRMQRELEEAKNRVREMADKARTQEEIEQLRIARDEAARKAEEELALRMAKEEEERENRKREEEHREKTQQEIDALKAAREEAERRAEEEAKKLIERQKEEEERRKVEEEERERQARELEELKKAYEDATKRAEIEERLKEEDRKRLAELEESLQQLELLLEEERQAKRDEEIVRALQARILSEETEKREELERLKEEQDALLRQEQEKREHLEQWSEELVQQRLEQARQLELERERLEELEDQRKAADEKLKAAMDKLTQAEEAKKLQERRKRELEKPVGLARLIQPSAKPLTTHRGVGAFTAAQFEIEKEKRQLVKGDEGNATSPSSEGTLNGHQENEVNGVTENVVEGER